MLKKAHVFAVLGFILIIGGMLRLAWIDRHALWQDEAETLVSAMQVLEVGYPYDTWKGNDLHENGAYIRIDHPKYEFASTNYFGSRFERNKGWLPYYILAATHPLWRSHVEFARLPFILMGVLTILVVYGIGSTVVNRQVGLAAALIHALSPLALLYEHQARYFAVASLLVSLTLFFLLRFHQSKKRRHIVGLSLAVILLFYTHIVASLLLVFFLVVFWAAMRIRQEPIEWKNVLLCFSIIGFGTLPWVVLVNFWTIFGVHLLTPYIYSQWFALVLAVAGVTGAVWIAIVQLTPRIRLNPNLGVSLVVLSVIIVVVFGPFFIPNESGGPRFYAMLLPLCAVLAAVAGSWWFRTRYWRAALALLGVIVVVVLTQAVYRGLPYVGTADWVPGMRSYFIQERISTDIPIFVSDMQFVYAIYTPEWSTELVWPIRKSFFDSLSSRLMFIFHRKHFSCEWFNLDKTRCTPEGFPFRDRIVECNTRYLGTDIVVYDCPAVLKK